MIITKKMGFKHFDTTVTISFLMILNLTVAYGQFLNNKPWPTYSLQNMPKTGFSCRDKILGGYYADSETQCQMFHVCVKVAGVGVQDFRFLCPNGTAFDQEAQICADWGDVDCEQATLYYSSDNFDLYRIGSGFESKRAPLAEEDEATFHLQRAETSDVRRSKQTVVNQSARPEQPSPIYQHSTERNYHQQQQQQQQKQSYNNDQFQYQSTKKLREPTIQKPTTTKKPYYQKPVDNQYSNVNSGKNYNSNNNQNDYQSDSRNDDELLKGSHSSNFFNNRNNGKEDDLVDFTKSPSVANIKRPNQRGRQRINRNQSRQNDYSANRNNIPTPPSKTTTTFAHQQPEKEQQQQQQQKSQKVVKNNSKTLTLQSSYRTAELHQYDLQPNYRNTTVTPLITSTTTQRYNNFTPTKPQTQQNIQPTTYNPSYNPYRTKSTLNYEDYKTPKPYTSTQSQNNNGNPFYNVQYEKAAEGNPDQYSRFSSNDDFSKHQTTTQNYNNFVQQRTTNNFGKHETDTKQQTHSTVDAQQHNIQPLIRRNDDQFSRQTSSKATTIKQNFENNNNNYQVPLTVRPLEAKRVNAGLTNQTHNNQNAIQNQNNVFNHQSHSHDTQSNHRAIPTPFSKPTTNTNSFQQSSFSSPTPRGFSHETTRISSPPSTGSFQQQQSTSNTNNRQQKISRNNENFTPSTTLKKFSTLVPKDQYFPTTFKPALYKKNGYNSIKTEKPRTNNFAAASYLPTTSTTTTSSPPRTSEPDEDDGQYHPELYEKDFPRNKIQTNKSRQRVTRPDYQQASTRQQTYHQTPSPAGLPADFGDEDEFLKPAHSLNIAYGANQLRNEKAEKAKQEQSSLKTSPIHKTSTVSTIRTTKTTVAATTSRSQPSPLPAGNNQKSKKPKPHDDDTSYDYAYYDTGSDNPHDYAEYDVISEFGKTKNRKHK